MSKQSKNRIMIELREYQPLVNLWLVFPVEFLVMWRLRQRAKQYVKIRTWIKLARGALTKTGWTSFKSSTVTSTLQVVSAGSDAPENKNMLLNQSNKKQ